MNILVSFDENYVNQAAIMLFSLAKSDPKEHFDIYILHSSLTENDIGAIRQYLDPAQCTLFPIAVDRRLLDGVPVTARYPKERYYRVLAAHYLPENLTRVLYLDTDLIVRKSLRGLYELDMQEKLFAAAPHIADTDVLPRFHEKRLQMTENSTYINSGVLLINLVLLREAQELAALLEEIRQHKGLLPDQDVVSALYADRIMQLDPYVYNMTERMLRKDTNLLRKVDFDWIYHNAAIIHYCGPNKPWNENYAGKLDIFYLETREEMHDSLSAPASEKTRSIEREITQQEVGPFVENARLFTKLMTQYRCAMMMVETKLRILYEEFSMRHDRNPFDTICTRLKRPASILEKLQRLGLPSTVQSIEENLSDIAGVRVVCRFQEDIYALSHMLEQQDDVILVRRKDYIRNPKPNGYRSLHLIVKVPVYFSNEKKYINVEVQFRTLAMNFWACLEHELKYKKNIENPGAIAAELKECAELINNIDNWMQRIRTTIDSCLQSSTPADIPTEVELPPEPPKSAKPEDVF